METEFFHFVTLSGETRSEDSSRGFIVLSTMRPNFWTNNTKPFETDTNTSFATKFFEDNINVATIFSGNMSDHDF